MWVIVGDDNTYFTHTSVTYKHIICGLIIQAAKKQQKKLYNTTTPIILKQAIKKKKKICYWSYVVYLNYSAFIHITWFNTGWTRNTVPQPSCMTWMKIQRRIKMSTSIFLSSRMWCQYNVSVLKEVLAWRWSQQLTIIFYLFLIAAIPLCFHLNILTASSVKTQLIYCQL
jgi:hypothetical protein